MRSIPEWLDFAEAFDPSVAAELWIEVDRFEREGMLHGTVEESTRPVLDRLRAAGLTLAVLTNNSLASAEAALQRFDLRAPFALVLARTVVPALEPDGAGVAAAQARLGGEMVVVVGDSYIDGLAAQRSGVGARFVAFRADLADLAARGVSWWASIDDLTSLPDLLLPSRGDVAAAP